MSPLPLAPRRAAARLACLRLRIALGILLLLLAPAASALTVICVDSVGELDSALRLAEDDDVRINLAQGSYDVEATPLDARAPGNSDLDHDVTLVGGYTDGSCAAREVDPAATVLYGDGGFVFTLGFIIVDTHTTLRSLTLRNFLRISLEAPDRELLLERVRVEDSGRVNLIARHIRISHSVFTDSEGDGECAVEVFTDWETDSVRMDNSLVTRGASKGFCINDADDFDEWGVATIENSILWGNAAADLSVQSLTNNDVVLRNNIIGTQDIDPASTVAPVGTLTADPQFVNPANGDFRLQITSPAKDSGTAELSSGLPAQDVEGLPRVVAGVIDRGPHENQSAALQFNYAVSTTADAGAGSLRQALIDSEANPGLNGIVFAIPGSGCPKLITVASPLPAITQDLVIDGNSQSGSVVGTDEVRFDAVPCIVLRSGPALSPDNGLTVAEGASTGSSAVINGLAFSGFAGAAIDLRGGGAHLVTGNQFGGQVGATALEENGYGVRVARSAAPELVGTQIGGPQPRQRNLLGGSQVAGVALAGAFVRDTQVIGNFIGLAANGNGALPNQFGVLNTGAVDTTLKENWIGSNSSDGVYLNTTRSYLQDNRIGLRAVPTGLNDDRGNGGWGVRIASTAGETSGNVVGSGITTIYGQPAPVGAGNVIAYNDAGGIRTDIGLGHRLSRNRVYANGSPQIDIGNPGPSGQDDNDSAPGTTGLPNRGLNDPFLFYVYGGPAQGQGVGTLKSRNGVYRIEFYSSAACSGGPGTTGEARVFHGAAQAEIVDGTSSQDGEVQFDFVVRATSLAPLLTEGRGFVALAIDADGNTSELSSCMPYQVEPEIFRDGFED